MPSLLSSPHQSSFFLNELRSQMPFQLSARDLSNKSKWYFHQVIFRGTSNFYKFSSLEIDPSENLQLVIFITVFLPIHAR